MPTGIQVLAPFPLWKAVVVAGNVVLAPVAEGATTMLADSALPPLFGPKVIATL